MRDGPPPGDAASGASARARRTAIRYARLADESVLGRVWERLLELEFIDRSVALASKAFVSFFPLLIVFASVLPVGGRQEMLRVIATRLGVSGAAFDLVRQAFASPDVIRTASGLVGVVLGFAYAVSFTTALQRVYLRSWRRPPGGGLRNKGRGVLWLTTVFGSLTFLSLLRSAAGEVGSWVLGLPISTALWWWTAHILLRGEVRWRPLLPTAVLTGIGVWLYAAAGSVWMPVTVTHDFEQFGTFGIALSFVSWFTGMAFLLVIAAAVGPSLVEGNTAVARWLSGPDAETLTDGAAPPLPGPARRVRLADAFGRGARGSGVDPNTGSADPGS